jgi:hypothetical protein
LLHIPANFVAAVFESAQINTKVKIAAFLALSGSATDNYQTFTEYTENNNVCQYYDGGCDYKGRGALMMRGGWSYRSAGNALSLSLESNPNSAATVPTVFQTAGWQWTKFLLNLNQFSNIVDWTTAKLAIKLIEYQDVSELNTKALTCLTTQVPCLTYTAVEGDTWDSIATQFQVTVAALEALNPGINEPAAGQKILIDGDPASCL